MTSLLWKIAMVFVPLSLLSIGGGQAIMADIQLQTVVVHQWLSNEQFGDLFAISRATPGPNTLIASLIGWQIAGPAGMLVATLAMFIPSSIVFVAVTSVWHRHSQSPWRKAVERGLAPIAVGLIFAGALTILQAIELSALGWSTTLIAAGVLYFTRTNPYLMIFSVVASYLAIFFIF